MKTTQNDLSYDKTKLDYQAMLTTARIAYGRCLEKVESHLREMQYWNSSDRAMLPYLSAQWLEKEAKLLTIAAETMYTLQQGLSRHELEIVNKPEVVES